MSVGKKVLVQRPTRWTVPALTSNLHPFDMPREPSDARAALMTVYMSQHSSFLNLSDTPKVGGKLKAAERLAPHRRVYAKNSTTTKMLMKSLKKPPHWRRRSDADECMHAIRTS